MNKEQLIQKIESLIQAAEGLEGSERTFKLNDARQLKIKAEGMSIADIAEKMGAISLPQISEMDDAITEASDAIKSHNLRVQAFNKAYGFIKAALV